MGHLSDTRRRCCNHDLNHLMHANELENTRRGWLWGNQLWPLRLCGLHTGWRLLDQLPVLGGSGMVWGEGHPGLDGGFEERENVQASSLKSSQCNSVCSYRAPLVCPAQQKQRCGDWPGPSCAQRERYLVQVLLVWLCSRVSVDSFSELLWDDQGNSWLCTKQTHLWYNNTEACPSVGGGVLFFRAGDEPHNLGHARQMAYHWATFLAHPSLLTQ